jgi:soluble lytic murein transglycosylase-like protein
MDTPRGRAKSHGWGPALVALVLACVLGLVALPGTAWSQGDSQGWMETGWQAYRSGALAEAEAAFSRAAAAAPGWATPAVWLGAVAMARRDWAAARRWFEAVLARHPTLAEAGYAEAWLGRLGIGVDRPRWRVRTVDEYAAFVRASNPALTLGQARWVGAAVLAAAARAQLDPRLLAAVVCIESRFEHRTVSSAGAEGLGQLMPETAAALGVNPVDPWQNLLGAARLLRGYYDAFHSLPLALAAYNAGSAAVRQWGGIPPYPETQWYVWAVLWVLGSLSA